MKIRHAVLAALCSTVVAVAMPTGTAAAAAPDSLPIICTYPVPAVKDGRIGRFFTTITPIYRGPSTSCFPVGRGQPRDLVRLDCWTTSVTLPFMVPTRWTHVLDLNTRATGWVPSAALVGGGARVHC